ncbi:MAG: alanine--tRNA ligase [Myxococcales bacterium]|jgi:alanyl-tRNA synthetase|nr:alanine--tRNA ligase [Myxococcales bacterium]
MKQLRASELRELFLSFFESKGHRRQPSSPLIPQNDPTLLFTNAGMVQFKDVFTGREKRDYTRACSSQKCVRAGGKHNDLENVGFTPRHHTFFEMLGNFSFGDYFKKDAIAFAWEFITSPDYLDISPDLLAVTIFVGEDGIPADEEAAEIWKAIGVRPERIFRLGRKDNFWQMGDVGPCGPCSEIHIYRGEAKGESAIDAAAQTFFADESSDPNGWMELWNLVFMQFEMLADGSLKPLPRPSIDTGAGLERLTAVLQGVESNFDIDLFRAIIGTIETLSGKTYGGTLSQDDVSMRVIADHARATAFLIADGVLPSNEGRGYVLRRILRRAIRYGARLGLDEPFLHRATATVIDQMGKAYPELVESQATIAEFVRNEEIGFRRTLDRGQRMLTEAMSDLAAKGQKEIPPETVFFLYDTHGFPADLTRLMAEENGFTVDEAAFEAYKCQRAASACFGGSGEKAICDLYHQLCAACGPTAFLGYERLSADCTIAALIRDGERVEAVKQGEEIEFICKFTPFYGESGGQVGDTGTATDTSGLKIDIIDTHKPVSGLVIHRGRVLEGELRQGQIVSLSVDTSRRQAVQANHTATHLLHLALRSVLGDHVKQAGSKVSDSEFRFDYTHFSALTAEEIVRIESIVNELIRANTERVFKDLSLAEARAEGAMMLFGEKYGERVRCIRFGDSVELCGGTHVQRTGDIGAFAIVGDESIAAGVRRISAVTGRAALERMQALRQQLADFATKLRTSPENLDHAIDKLQANLKTFEKAQEALQKKSSAMAASVLVDRALDFNGVKVVTERFNPANLETFRAMADQFRDKLPSSIIGLGGEKDGKAVLMVAVGPRAVERGFKAGDLVREMAKEVGGKGGGKPDLAQAGGPDASRIEQALAKLYDLIEKQSGLKV